MNLTVRDAAKLLGVSEKSIYRWIGHEGLPALKIHDQYRFNRAELLEWATKQRINVNPAIFTEPEAESAMPSLSEALQAGGISYRIDGTERETVLRQVVENMRLPEEVDRSFLLQVLLAREELGSTAIGDGIAIPHVRNPVVLHVNKPTVTLSFLEHPVDFKALDGKPVTVLFTLVSPTVRAHLHMLSRLSFALRDETFKAAVLRQAARDDLLTELRRVEAVIPATSHDAAEESGHHDASQAAQEEAK